MTTMKLSVVGAALVACLMGCGSRPGTVEQGISREVRAERISADLERLVSFGTRHTLSERASETRGIGAAARWCLSRFEDAGAGVEGFSSEMEEFEVPPSVRVPEGATLTNVVARLEGAVSPEREFYVVAHYDSRALDVLDAETNAPGANDDGSGTVLVLELARVLAERGRRGERLDCTVVFLLTSGEEQGLLGARYHASQAAARGAGIEAVLSSDIVGDPTAPAGSGRADERYRVRVFSPGIGPGDSAQEIARAWRLGAENDSASRQLARAIDRVSEARGTVVRPLLINRMDRFLRGGDHYAFIEAGFAGVRFSEVHENYARQHQDPGEAVGGGLPELGDVLEAVDPGYIADVAGLQLAVLEELASAPAAPKDARLITAELTNDTTMRWSPSDGAAGYEVVWRATTEHRWTDAVDVGNVTEYTLRLSKDNWLFGVRAYGDDGRRSMVVFPSAARE